MPDLTLGVHADVQGRADTTERRSMNGGRTRPLTAHARGVLRELARAPMPRQNMNPGVADRLERGDFAEVVMLPSPFEIHHGANIRYMRITAGGVKELAHAE